MLKPYAGSFTVKEFSINSGLGLNGHNKANDANSYMFLGLSLIFSVGRHKLRPVTDFWNARVSSCQCVFEDKGCIYQGNYTISGVGTDETGAQMKVYSRRGGD